MKLQIKKNETKKLLDFLLSHENDFFIGDDFIFRHYKIIVNTLCVRLGKPSYYEFIFPRDNIIPFR